MSSAESLTIDVRDVALGKTFPNPDDLQTGDLLFPRKITALEGPSAATSSLMLLATSLTGREREMTVRQYLGPLLSLYAETVGGGRASEQTLFDARHQTEAAPLKVHAGLVGAGGKGKLAFLLAILRLEFADILFDWFGLKVEDFLHHPLLVVLQGAFDNTVQDSFFIGHCAMVLRETDGAHSDAGDVYVIEANASSFDHYSVSMHPYLLPGDGAGGGGRYRSWAGFRASRGDCCWHSRHVFFDQADAAAAQAARQALLAAAKLYLGRTYSFFDTPVFGDHGRLYCSELLYRAYEDVRAAATPLQALDDGGVRTWDWMRANNPMRRAGDLGDTIEKVYANLVSGPSVSIPDRPFFIITVQMLWRQPVLGHLLLPYGVEYG